MTVEAVELSFKDQITAIVVQGVSDGEDADYIRTRMIEAGLPFSKVNSTLRQILAEHDLPYPGPARTPKVTFAKRFAELMKTNRPQTEAEMIAFINTDTTKKVKDEKNTWLTLWRELA